MNSILSQDAAEALLEPHLHVIGDCLREAVDRFHVERSEYGPVSTRTRASQIHDFAAEAAERYFADVDGVKLLRDHGFLVISFNDQLLMRFKKLNDHLGTYGIPTHQARLWASQEPLPGMPAVTHLVAGYVLDELGDIDRLVIVCACHRRVLWTIELDHYGYGRGVDLLPLAPIDPEPAGAVVRSITEADRERQLERQRHQEKPQQA